MTDFRSRNVMTGRFRTHYTECGGNGPALVLCHGGGPGSSGEAGFVAAMGIPHTSEPFPRLAATIDLPAPRTSAGGTDRPRRRRRDAPDRTS